MSFPTTIDAPATPGAKLSTNPHSSLHTGTNTSIVAIETKLGIDNSVDTTSIDYLLKNTSSTSPGHKHVAADVSGLPTLVYSNFTDGNVTASTGTLTKDMFYNVLTVPQGVTLSTGGYKIFARQIINDGTIKNDGVNASGLTAGTGGVGVTVPAGTDGKNGGAAGVANGGAGGPGVAGANSTHNIVNSAGSGGGVGGTATGSGGSASSGGTNSASTMLPYEAVAAYYLFDFTSGTAIQRLNLNSGSGSGGGGGASTSNNGGAGGGGGGGGGMVWIKANIITNTGTISAVGGNGANGVQGTAGTAAGGGGGGGGNGGVIMLIYTSLTNSGTITAAGGSKGTGGLTGGGSASGANGVDGAAGLIIKMSI